MTNTTIAYAEDGGAKVVETNVKQRDYWAYDEDVFVGRIIATPKQFEDTGYRSGTKPAPVIATDMVNVEAKRRIYNLVKAKDEQSSNENQRNLLAEYSALQDVLLDGGTLTTAQKDRRKRIKDGNELLKAIVAASNVLTAMDKIPTAYKNNSYWPEGS